MTCPITAGSRVWGYARDSGGDEQSIDDQINAIRDYCAEHNLVIEKLFTDRARPGSTTAGRDQFQAMITLARNLAERDRPAGVVFWSFSRLSRDYDDAAFFTADLRRHGLKLASIADDIPDGPFARVIESLTHWKNQQFLHDLSQDVSRGLRDLAKQGYAPGGFPPRGYNAKKIRIGTKNDGSPRMASQWVPDPELAPLVKRAFELRAQGASYKQIRDEVGIYSSTSSWSCFFRNETYLGIRKCDDLRVEDAHEPLITRDLWDAVQDTLQERVGKGGKWPEGQPHPRRQNSKHGPYLLTGVGRCLYCGAAITGGTDNVNSRPSNWPYYLCSAKKLHGWDTCEGSKIDQRPVNAVVVETVITRVLTQDYLAQIVEATNRYLASDLGDVTRQINDAQARLARVDHAIEGLLDLVVEGIDANVKERLVALGQQKKRLQSQLKALRLKRERKRLEVPASEVRFLLTQAQEQLAGEDVLARRTLLKQFVASVEIGRERGRLWATFPLEQIDEEVAGIWRVPPRENQSIPCREYALAWY